MKVLIGQTGAPTAVVNRSLGGFLGAVEGHQVAVVRGGPDALVNGPHPLLADFAADEVPGPETFTAAGSWLGGGRRSIDARDVTAIVERLVTSEVVGVSLIGGNGTMALLVALAVETQRQGAEINFVGIPKTIDNDLAGTDHTPGFPSTARFLARTVTDLVRDHAAMAGVEQVRIVETMGRDTGWLALAATYARHDPGFAPDLVLLPELEFSAEEFLNRVAAVVEAKGRALVVVSEGVAPELSRQPIHDRNHTQLIHGGLSRALATLVAERLGLTARGEVIGTVQRSASSAVGAIDAREAEAVGRLAGEWLLAPDGPRDVMVSLTPDRSPDYRSDFTPVDLAEVGGVVRSVPTEWRHHDPTRLEAFHDWLQPLIDPVACLPIDSPPAPPQGVAAPDHRAPEEP